MLIDDKKVLSVAKLAQLTIPVDERQTIVEQLDAILSLMKSLDEVDTEQTTALSNPHDALLSLRKDEVTEVDNSTLLQSLATNTKDGLYLVPKVIDDN